jgi:hypothetical protein
MDRVGTFPRENTPFNLRLHRGSFPFGNAMLCYSSRQMADEDYCDPCLFVPSTTGFVQAPSYRGRLYYLPTDTKSSENTPSGLFRNRVARPSLLCIASVAAERSASRPATSFDHKTSYIFGKLARSREQAKRFLRFSFSQNPTPPVQPVPFQLPAERSLDGVEAGDMVFADAGRRQFSCGRADQWNGAPTASGRRCPKSIGFVSDRRANHQHHQSCQRETHCVWKWSVSLDFLGRTSPIFAGV